MVYLVKLKIWFCVTLKNNAHEKKPHTTSTENIHILKRTKSPAEFCGSSGQLFPELIYRFCYIKSFRKPLFRTPKVPPTKSFGSARQFSIKIVKTILLSHLREQVSYDRLLNSFSFFAAYVICKKNYSFSRVVFFQTNIANFLFKNKWQQ